jgi:multimeric flavodoxin WrbA
MVSAETKSVIDRARRIYANQLQNELESKHMGRFVAIEPESGEYFLGDTFDEAVKSARTKYPSRLSHTIRVGHGAAFHIGGL